MHSENLFTYTYVRVHRYGREVFLFVDIMIPAAKEDLDMQIHLYTAADLESTNWGTCHGRHNCGLQNILKFGKFCILCPIKGCHWLKKMVRSGTE